MTNQIRNGIKKISKGYRLKISTHKMVDKIQLMTNSSKDTVIGKALKLYYTQISTPKNLNQKILKKKTP